MPDLGRSIARLLSEEGISESELAARAGISQSYVSRIIAGEVTNPTIDFVLRLADALGLTVSELLGQSQGHDVPATPRTRAQLNREITFHLHQLQRLVEELTRTE